MKRSKFTDEQILSIVKEGEPDAPPVAAARAAISPVPAATDLTTSSRKSVPPSASSTRPARSVMAPVNAPRAWPKSSDSSNSSGRAAQLEIAEPALPAWAQAVNGACHELLPHPALARERPVVGNSWSTCQRTSLGRVGGGKRAGTDRTRVRIPTGIRESVDNPRRRDGPRSHSSLTC